MHAFVIQVIMPNFNKLETFFPSDQRYGNLKIKALNKEAKLIIKKTTGEDTFTGNYEINFYDCWMSVDSDKCKQWYPIKSILSIKEERNTICFNTKEQS